MKRNISASLVILASLSILFSCKKDYNTNHIQPYTVPDTYNFDDVDYTEAAQIVAMWSGFTGYLGKATSRQLSQDTVNNLWNNINSSFKPEFVTNLSFAADQLNGATINLFERTAEPAIIKALADSIVVNSQYFNTPASEGVAGRMLQSNG